MSETETVSWWHTFHRWSKWKEEQGIDAYGDKRMIQTRNCVVCNKTEILRMVAR